MIQIDSKFHETLTLDPIPIPKSVQSEHKREPNLMGKKGKGWSTSPLRSAIASSAHGEKRAEPGSLLAGLSQGGAAARPLDGGALTRWGARTPTRGAATAPWLPAHSLRPLGRRSPCCGDERRESGEERESKEAEWPLGFRGRAPVAFCSTDARAAI